MRFLLINTCGEVGVVALAAEAEGVLAEERLPARGSSEHLLGAVRAVLGRMAVRELGGVGVVVGPGSFTGVRVGLSAAKGFCEAGGMGMIALSRLELVAESGVALLDAGRGEFYCGEYGDTRWEGLIGREEAEERVRQGHAATCEERVLMALGEGVRLVDEPGGVAMLRGVLVRVSMGAWSDVAAQDAMYLRRTDAELALERR